MGTSPGRKFMDVGRHIAIVDAIATGDADTAADAVRSHMTEAASNVVA